MKNYWEKFYKEYKLTKNPTNFAKFIKVFIKKKNFLIYDIGSGNGRDSYYLGRTNKVIGVDYATLPKDIGNVHFIKESLNNFIKNNKCKADIVYGRFLFHSIDDKLINNILKWSKNIFATEFRSDNNKNEKKFFKHKRFYSSNEKILNMFIKNNYKIIYFEESRGFAKFKEKNPLVVRIIAEKKHGR
jgi:SAM-dependent methyltransferase